MAERDDQSDDKGEFGLTTGQKGQASEYGERGQTMRSKDSEGSHRNDDGTSGQPIGGNDSATGTGTTLTQGADFGLQSSGSQAPTRQDGGDTLTSDRTGAILDERTTSQSGRSRLDTDQSSGGSSGVSGGNGFVGSRADDNSDYLRGNSSSEERSRKSTGEIGNLNNAASAPATGGSDFASEGQGALDEDELGSGSITDDSDSSI